MSNSSLDIVLCGTHLFGFGPEISPQLRADLLHSSLLAQALSEQQFPLHSTGFQAEYQKVLARIEWTLLNVQHHSFTPSHTGNTPLDQRLFDELAETLPYAPRRLAQGMFKTLAALPHTSTFAQALKQRMFMSQSVQPDTGPEDPTQPDADLKDPPIPGTDSEGPTKPDEGLEDSAQPGDNIPLQARPPLKLKPKPPEPALKTHLSLNFNLMTSRDEQYSFALEFTTVQDRSTLGLHTPLHGKALRGTAQVYGFTSILRDDYKKIRNDVIAKLEDRIKTEIITLDTTIQG